MPGNAYANFRRHCIGILIVCIEKADIRRRCCIVLKLPSIRTNLVLVQLFRVVRPDPPHSLVPGQYGHLASVHYLTNSGSNDLKVHCFEPLVVAAQKTLLSLIMQDILFPRHLNVADNPQKYVYVGIII